MQKKDTSQRPLESLYNTPMRRTLLHAFLSAITLLVGSLLYIIYRPTNLLVFSWIDAVGADDVVLWVRHSAIGQDFRPPGWVLYSLVDMLWVVSFGHAIYAVLADSVIRFRGRCAVALTIGSVAIISEVGQAVELVPGTFDWYDLLFYGLGIIWLIYWALIEARLTRQITRREQDNHE